MSRDFVIYQQRKILKFTSGRCFLFTTVVHPVTSKTVKLSAESSGDNLISYPEQKA